MAAVILSQHDANVLEKIKDPESNSSASVLVDPSLPKDPLITDPSVYERISQRERDVVLSVQQLEMQLAGLKPVTSDPIKDYHSAVSRLGDIISEYPKYASARNNRAQALRRLYGDTMLLQTFNPRALVQACDGQEIIKAAKTALSDLDEAIRLLTPKSLFALVSPQTGKILSLAYTQRAAIYHMTAKSMSDSRIYLGEDRKETEWTRIKFEEAASRDFAQGGRFGNEIAKQLAVSTNPTAKLCGQMVREALKKEYEPAYED
ncbi:uncharacterized protein BCR38DRAFT_344043 [Pseudomassariella vexata]|uniref:Tetratricopeptide repeat protein 36 n=1 Tax=Pseudomassariella vexata TaxID=1141098 RepID=A0A1Y2DXS3_9PEZI|nr:uncharacterized protein BCR38DRAFT_344043 [Pseudomassariella vexata]ORY64037.1 hypothetical protein BCR38DRAFT_344043 [Pseudomassariella vexata]